MKIIFVRHGETDTNLLEKQGKATLKNDAPLNEMSSYDCVVVSHGGVAHAFRAYFNNLEWKGNLRVDRLGNCDIRVYETSNEKKEIRIRNYEKREKRKPTLTPSLLSQR
ncbi:hypothetical protein IKG68_00040 [Candidatus Saccharibacteria bacterium]|nr:hypothetical protein [Candidatus Saccharibacteria bacterium]